MNGSRYSFCHKEHKDHKVGIFHFAVLCVLCVLCGYVSPLCAVQVADLSRDGVGLVVDTEPEAVDLARDFNITVTLSTPSGVTAELPDLRDRFQGFRVAENFAEKPVTDKDGRTTTVSRRSRCRPATVRLRPRPSSSIHPPRAKRRRARSKLTPRATFRRLAGSSSASARPRLRDYY